MKKLTVLCLCMFVIFISTPVFAERVISAWTPKCEGIWYATGTDNSPRLMKAFAIRIDTANPNIYFHASPGNGGGAPYEFTRQTTPDFMFENDLKTAFNAVFFAVASPTYDNYTNASGVVISDGTLYSGAQVSHPVQLNVDVDNVVSLIENSTSQTTDIYAAVGTDQMILEDGTISGDNVDINSRTAVGLTEDGRFLIAVVIDGEQTGWSLGCTIRESAQWLKDFGAYDGARFDGGGSSTLCGAWDSDGVLNSPDEGEPRSVAASFGAGSSEYNPRMDLWRRTSGGDIVRKFWIKDSGWSEWRYYGQPSCGSASSPCAVSREPYRTDIFIRGDDGKIYRKYYAGGEWSNWYSIPEPPNGVTFYGDPDVCSDQNDKIHIITRTTDNDCYWIYWQVGQGYSSWTDLNGNITGNPSIASWGPGRIDIFAKTTSGNIGHIYNDGSWSSWENLVGHADGGLDATSDCYGKIRVFFISAAANMYMKTYDGSWSSSTSLGGGWDSNPGATSYQRGHMAVFCRASSDKYAYVRNCIDGTWDASWTDLGGYYAYSPDASSWSNDSGTHAEIDAD